MNEPWDTLAKAITRLGDRIDALPGIREATVTATSPLEVTFDTDTLGTLVFGSLVSWLEPGDRVLTLRLARYVWVLGRRGGGPAFITTSPKSDDAPSTFGRGVTVSAIDNGNTDGYPAGANLATLLTVRHNDFRAFQLLSAKTSPMLWHRGVNAGGTEWEPWTEIGHGILYGTAAQRAATPSRYWQFWQDTDGDQLLWVGDKSGGWRRYSGFYSWTAAAWDTRQVSGSMSLAGRTIGATIPTVIEDNERLVCQLIAGGSGFTFVGGSSFVRNANDTTLNFRYMQIGSTVTQAGTIAWWIQQIGVV